MGIRKIFFRSAPQPRWIAAVSAATARRCAAARLVKTAPVGRFVLREYCDAASNLLGSRATARNRFLSRKERMERKEILVHPTS